MYGDRPGRILVIDDEKAIRQGCKMSLGEMGHLVETAKTGHQGLEMLLAGEYDLTLLDMRLPDLDGMEILRQGMSSRPENYIIVMTGYSTVQNAVEALKLGAFDYLTKPFTDDELVLAVDKALEKKLLVEENQYLRRELLNRYSFSNIVGESKPMLKVFEQIEKVAPTDSTVLIVGESGTGKELVAGAIHAHSKRAAKQFVAVDCSTLSPGLLESELFGHVKGAFTGAAADKRGIFEVAQAGTLFLDDIVNLNLETQAKLLRVLEAGEFKPVGGAQFKKTNVRIIAATNKDLRIEVEEGSFRQDLYYRFSVFPIHLPPLRQRKQDIPRLAYHFLRMLCRKTSKKIEGLSDEALELLVNHPWPGNVRQLKNVIERLVIMADGDSLDLTAMVSHLSPGARMGENPVPESLAELKSVKKTILEQQFEPIQKTFLIQALKNAQGNISRAAKNTGMQRSNFSALLKKYGIAPSEVIPEEE